MLIVLGRARAVPGRRADLVAAAREVAAATRADDGCISYGFAADLDDPDVVVGIEVWRDRAALDAHMGHPHTAHFLEQVGGLLDGAPDMAFHTTTD